MANRGEANSERGTLTNDRGSAAADRGSIATDQEQRREVTRESGTAGAARPGAGEVAEGSARPTTPSASAKRSGRSNRGFASMDPAKQREIASKGGKAAHAKGTAHEWTSEEAREAGRKGGEAVSRDRAHMSQIGREGGEARGNRNRNASA
jgi:general stress protein YciG